MLLNRLQNLFTYLLIIIIIIIAIAVWKMFLWSLHFVYTLTKKFGSRQKIIDYLSFRLYAVAFQSML